MTLPKCQGKWSGVILLCRGNLVTEWFGNAIETHLERVINALPTLWNDLTGQMLWGLHPPNHQENLITAHNSCGYSCDWIMTFKHTCGKVQQKFICMIMSCLLGFRDYANAHFDNICAPLLYNIYHNTYILHTCTYNKSYLDISEYLWCGASSFPGRLNIYSSMLLQAGKSTSKCIQSRV